MPLSGMLTCGSCGTRTLMSQMRYNLGGNKLICPDCVVKERSAIKPGTTQPGNLSGLRLQRERLQQLQSDVKARTAATDAGLEEAQESSEMVSYYCRACNFRFSRKKEFEVMSCPYCGRQAVAPTYGGKAQDLIEEVGHEEEGLI